MTMMMTRHVDGAPFGLTACEQSVARLTADGYSDPEIAAQLICAPSTVKTHQANIRRKMDVRNRVEVAVAWVRRAA